MPKIGDRCFAVSPECPVELSNYGYAPNLAGNTLFCVLFGLCGLLQLAFGLRYRTWTWMIGLASGCLLEMAGYVGRILMHYNVWDSPAFKLQIVALILSPSFIAAGINLTLKHVALTFGERWSRIQPRLYTWVFISFDVFCILVQAAGGGIAASAGSENPNLLKTGDNVIIAGIALQIAQLAVLGVVAAEYAFRLVRNRAQLSSVQLAYAHSFKFRAFVGAIVLSYAAILTRCIYRMPEMAGGWGEGLQRDEPKFLVLDGAMVCLAALLLTAFHPGIFFPQLARSGKHRTDFVHSPLSTASSASTKTAHDDINNNMHYLADSEK